MAKTMVFGELGAFGGGMGLRVLYVQCALPIRDIGKITLAEELPGSEEWPVRDLFQRDVDYDRVENGILPWLEDIDKVKFFAPITLALLPFDASTERLESEIPLLERTGRVGVLSFGGMFELKADALPAEFSGRATLSWSSKRCHLVALDGQHRVAALRAVAAKGGAAAAAVKDWSIPAVVMCVVRESRSPNRDRVSFLDVARSVFVYINTQARSPSRSRQILLNDESPSAIIAQEFVQLSHEADIDSAAHFPMSAIRWRDGTEASIGDKHKLLQLSEIHDLFDALLLGDARGGRREISAALLSSGSRKATRLAALLAKSSLNANEAHEFRELIQDDLLPAFAALTVGLRPYDEFAQRVRVIERRLADQGEPGNAALHAIRIGGAGNWRARSEVAQLVSRSVTEMGKNAASIPELFRNDIGLRGVVSGFGQALQVLREDQADDTPLVDLVDRYIGALNTHLAKGWLVGVSEQSARHLRHVTRNDAGGVRNYRFEDVPDALGALCASIGAAGCLRSSSPRLRTLLKDALRKRLFETVRQGYVGEFKRKLREQYPSWSPGEVKDKAQERSRPAAARHIDHIVEDLGLSTADV
jgi:hypothetical protein